MIIEGLSMITDGLRICLNKNEVSANVDAEFDAQIQLDRLREIMIEKSKEGKSEKIKEIIRLFNADKLSDVDKKHYKELLNMVEQI